MRILIVGASGMVGGHVMSDLEQLGDGRVEIVGTYCSRPIERGTWLDIRRSGAIGACLKEVDPDAVIWLAGSKDVSALERAPELSVALNEEPVLRLVEAAYSCRRRIRLVYISSDYVFDGRQGGYLDNSSREPDTVYGRSKRRAEDILAASGLNVVCIRTAAVMSLRGGFLQWMVGEIRSGKEVGLFSNTIFSPTPPSFLSRAVWHLTCHGTSSPLVNFAGPAVSRFDIGRHFCQQFGLSRSMVREEIVDFAKATLHPNLSLVTSGELAFLAPKSLEDFTQETCS